jgi:hypothetical protein
MNCEDCGEVVETRRTRCWNCKMLLCSWCYNHCHMLAVNSGDDGCGLRPKFSERQPVSEGEERP